jgi:hypothetical protein
VAANTAARHNAVTLGVTNGLELSGQQLSLGLASAGVTGALSGTDWSTFNNKQNALTNPVTGTGTSGRVAYWNGTNSITSDSDLLFDGSNLIISGDIGLTNGANRQISIGSASNYNYRLRTDGDDFVITEAGITDRLRYSYSNVRWIITGGLTVSASTTLSNLAGSGTRMVVADASGFLSTQAITIGTVTSVAALTLGTSGTDLSSSVANGTTTPVITLNVPTASASNRGALSAADWTAFNSKQQALNGTGFVKISGTTISYDNSTYLTGNQTITLSGDATGSGATAITVVLANSGVTAGTYNDSATQVRPFTVDAKGRITSIGTAVTITPDWANISGQRTLTRDDAGLQGNAGARSGFFQSEVPVNYYSGATSWQHLIESRHTNDSNNYAMQIAGSFFDQEFYVRKTNNSATTAWSRLWHSGNITPVTGTGTSGQVAFFNGTSSITGESNLFWDATNDRLGIGTATPATRLHIANSSSAVLFAQDGTTATIVGANAAGSSSQGLFLRGFPLTFTGNGGGSAAQMTLDSSGILGVGVTPSAWNLYKAIQVQNASISNFDNSDNSIVGSNVFYGGSPNDFRYISDGTSTVYRLNNSVHSWFIAPSGTAGNAISFTQAMTLNASGNVQIGTTSTQSGTRLLVAGVTDIWSRANTLLRLNHDGTRSVIESFTDGGYSPISISPNGGNLLVGTTTDAGYKLDVNGTGRFSSSVSATSGVFSSVVNVNGASTTEALNVNGNIMLQGTANRYIRLQSATNYFYNLSSVNDDFQILEVGSIPRLTIKYPNGNVGVGTINPGVKFVNSGGNNASLPTFGSGTIGSDAILSANGLYGLYTGVSNEGHVWQQVQRNDGGTSVYPLVLQPSGGNVGIATTTPNSRLQVNGSVSLPHTTKSANYTLTDSDYTVGFDCASNRTATLPDATTCAGRIYVIYQYNTNIGLRYVTIDGNGSQTINGLTTVNLQYQEDFSSIMIQSNGSNWVVIASALYAAPV